MARKRLNKKVAISALVFVGVLVLAAIGGILYLSRDPAKFIQDGDAARKAAQQAQDPETKQQQYEAAGRSYRKAYGLVKQDPVKVAILAKLVEMYVETAQWPKVQGSWAGILQIEPTNTKARYGRLRYMYIMADSGVRAAWREVAEQVSEFFEVVDEKLLEQQVQQWEAFGPDERRPAEKLGACLYLMRGRALLEMAKQGLVTDPDRSLSQAAEDLEKARELEPSSSQVYLHLAQLAVARGRIMVSRGNLQEGRKAQEAAREVLQQGLETAGHDPRVHLNLLQIKRVLSERRGTEQLAEFEPEFLRLVQKFPQSSEVLVSLAGLYLSDIKNFDRGLQLVEKAVELDKENASYATDLANLYYRKFCFYGRRADLDKAIEAAEAALELPGAQEMGGPRSSQNRMNRILLCDLLANCYIEPIPAPDVQVNEQAADKRLSKAEKAVREIEQLVGSGEAPQVIKWQGMLELARGDKGNRPAAIRKLYTVYEQLKASAIEDAPMSHLVRCYSALSYALGKIFQETDELGAAGSFLASALNTDIMTTRTQALLDHAEILIKLGYFSQALSDIDVFEQNFGANQRSQALRVRSLIATNQFDDAEEQLVHAQLDEPNEVNLKLVLVGERIRQVQAHMVREQLRRVSDVALGPSAAEPDRKGSETVEELMAAELADYKQQLVELVDKSLLSESASVEGAYIWAVLQNHVAEGRLDRARDLVERVLAVFPDGITTLVYRQVLLEPDPMNVPPERLVEIEEQVALDMADSSERARQLGLYYYNRGEFEKAAGQLKEFLRFETVDANRPQIVAKFDEQRRLAFDVLFDVALRVGDWDLAQKLLTLARDRDIDEAEGNFFAARYAVAEDDHEQALSKLNECIKLRPVFSKAYLLRSRVNSALDNEDAAIEDARKASTFSPASGEIARQLALLLYKRNKRFGTNASSEQVIETRVALEQAMRLNSGDTQLPSLYAEFISNAEPDRALAIRQRLHKIQPSAENAVLLGRMAMRIAAATANPARKKLLLDMAESAFGQALELEPENKAVLDGFAQYYRQTGQGEKAEQLLAKSQDPKLLWRHFYRNGQYDKARETVLDLYEADPQDIGALKGLLLVAEKSGDLDALKKYSERLVSLEDNAENRLFQVQSFLGAGLVKEAEHKLQSLREKLPDEPRAMLLESWLAAKKGQLEKALELANRSLALDQDNALAWRIHGEISRLMANYERAITDLKRSRSLSNDPVTRVTLAKAYLQAGREDDAIIELKTTIENPQAPVQAWDLLEQIYRSSGRKQDMKRFYEKTLSAFSESALWRLRAGNFALSEGNLQMAERLYLEALKLSRNVGGVDAEAALDGYLEVLLVRKQLDRVFEEASKYVAGRLASVAYLRMAEAKLKLGDETVARKYCKKCLERTESKQLLARPEPLQRMYSMLGSDVTIGLCKARLAGEPDSVAANLAMFELLRIDGQYNRALIHIDKCLEIEQTGSGAGVGRLEYVSRKANVLMLAYMRTSDNNYLKRAVGEYESLLVKMPNNTSVLNNLAYILAEEDVRLDEALGYAEHAHKMQPNNPDLMDTYAYVLCKKGRYSEAAGLLRAALQQYETSGRSVPVEVYEHLGQACEQLGASDEALAAYKQALEVGREGLSEKVRTRVTEAVKRLNSKSED